MTPRTLPTMLAILVATSLCTHPVLAQTSPKAVLLQFEVASVRPTPANAGPAFEQDRSWGEGSGRVVLRKIPLKFVLLEAFEIRAEQLHGPSWLDDLPFDITANAPAGTPKAQIRLMMQALLQDRFKLKFHREAENRMVNLLTVRKGGPLLKEAVPGFTSSGPLSEKDYTKLGKGSTMAEKAATMSSVDTGKYGRFKLEMFNGVGHSEFEGITMPQFAEYLNQFLPELPVVDGTGLTGSYQVTIDRDATAIASPAVWASRGLPPPEPRDVSPIPEQLKKMGLELVRQRIESEKFVIDSIERAPTAN